VVAQIDVKKKEREEYAARLKAEKEKKEEEKTQSILAERKRLYTVYLEHEKEKDEGFFFILDL
jgi:hypothetical protein